MKRRNPLIAFLLVICTINFVNAQQINSEKREETRKFAQKIEPSTVFQEKVAEVAYLDSVVSNVLSPATSAWYRNQHRSNIRDANNIVVSESVISFNDDKSFRNGYRNLYKFNDLDLVDTKEKQDAIAIDDWINSTKDYMSYDALSNMDSLLVKAWQVSANTWYKNNLTVNQYNGNNQRIQTNYFTWNVPTLKWNLETLAATIYGNKEETTIVEGISPQTGEWDKLSKTETYYDDQDRFTNIVRYTWEGIDEIEFPGQGDWILSTETEVSYDDEGKLTELSRYVYSGGIAIFGEKSEYQYQNGLHAETVYHSYNIGTQAWNQSYHKIINRDVSGNVLYVQDQYWDEVAGVYKDTHQNWEYYYTYVDETGNPTDTTTVVDPTDTTIVDPTDTIIVDPIDTTNTALENIKIEAFDIAPNPSYGYFTIKNNSLDGELLNFTMFNTAGEAVIQSKFQTSLEVNATHLPKGIYLIQIGDNEQALRKKVIIQ